MEVFPAFVPLAGAKAALAGAGEGLEAKSRLLAGAPCEIVRIQEARAFDEDAYEGACLAFIAHPDPAFRARAAAAAKAAGALVNVTDAPELCDFHTPAIIDRGRLVAAIGTGGGAPQLASILRGEIEARLPEGVGVLAGLLAAMQGEIRAAQPDPAQRRARLRAVLSGPGPAMAQAGDLGGAAAAVRAALAAAPPPGGVSFIDGSGPPDLFSLRIVRALGAADAVLADVGVPAATLALVRRDAHRLPAGTDLAPLALQGWQVVRLTDGAPDANEIVALDYAGLETVILRPAPE